MAAPKKVDMELVAELRELALGNAVIHVARSELLALLDIVEDKMILPPPELVTAVGAAIAEVNRARGQHPHDGIEGAAPFVRVAILTEEVGEVARAQLEILAHLKAVDRGTVEAHAQRTRVLLAALRAELAQVAACALMWLATEERRDG